MVEGTHLLILQIVILCLVIAGMVVTKTAPGRDRYKHLSITWSLQLFILSLTTIIATGYFLNEEWLNFGVNIAILIAASVSIGTSLAANFRGYLSAALQVSDVEKKESNIQ